jgi:hypothetical protein
MTRRRFSQSLALLFCIVFYGFPALADPLSEGERRQSLGIYNEQGQLVRSWTGPASQIRPASAWDGLDWQGEPLPAGTYTWRSLTIDPDDLGSKWVTAIGAEPAVNDAGEPMYFPGAIFGSTRLATSDDAMFLGAVVGDASDILMKTDLDMERAHWSVDLYQPSLHSVGSMRFGGPKDLLYILQAPNRLHAFAGDERQLWVREMPAFNVEGHGTLSQLAVNEEFLAISYPNDDLIRLYRLPGLEHVRDMKASAPAHLDFLEERGASLAYIDRSAKQVVLLRPNGDKRHLELPEVEAPHIVRRHGKNLVVGEHHEAYFTIDKEFEKANRENGDGVPIPGAQAFLISRGGEILRTFGTGENHYQGEWNPLNMTGILDIAITDETMYLIDWLNRVVKFDLSTGEFIDDTLMGAGSYYNQPFVVAGESDKLWVRTMFGMLVWQFSIDLEEGTWSPDRLMATQLGAGATQNTFYRAHRIDDDLFFVADGQVELRKVVDHRPKPTLAMNALKPEGAEGEHFYMINRDPDAGEAEVVARPELSNVPGLNLQAMTGDGDRLAATSQFNPKIFEIPATLNDANVPVPDWEKTSVLYDASASFPGLDLYITYPGFFDEAGNYYSTVADRNVAVVREKDQHLYWPGIESAHSWLFKVSPEGKTLFEVGRVSVDRSEPDGFVQPMPSGMANGFVFVTDRATPGQRVFTEHGLYVGNSWERSMTRPEDIPTTLRDPYTRADIIQGAVLTSGDRTFHAQANINRVDLFEVLGLETVTHEEGTVELLASPEPPLASGEGLRGHYFSDAGFSKPLVVRKNERIAFSDNPNMFDHTWKAFPENARSAIWQGYLTVPVSDLYEFDLAVASPNDTVFLKVGEETLIDKQGGLRPQRVGADPIWLEAGEAYPVEVRYGASAEQRMIRFNAQTPSRNRQSVPAAHLYQTNPKTGDNWPD